MPKKLRLLDLFCGAGGCSVGYHRAGFEVCGVDNKPQPRYPFRFYQADALEFVALYGHLFDVIAASPPCWKYSISSNNGAHPDAPDLIGPVRELLLATGKPYIIENVVGAPLIYPITICGASFGLGVAGLDLNRHRLFESNVPLLAMPCQHVRGRTIGVYGGGTNSYHLKLLGRGLTVDDCREAMGIAWMTRAELNQAIPPAYTEWIGRQIISAHDATC